MKRAILAAAAFVIVGVTPGATASGGADTTPPILKLRPYAGFVVGSSIGPSAPIVDGDIEWEHVTSGIEMIAKWRAADPSGICGYDVWEEGAGYLSPHLMNTRVRRARASTTDYDDEWGGGTGKFMGYRVTAYDCAGNTTTKSTRMTPHVIQEDGSTFNGHGLVSFTYRGNWATSNFAGFSGGHTRKTSTKGASVKIRVNTRDWGQHVALVMEKAPNRGKAAVFVDGKYRKTINTYSPTKRHRVIVYDVRLTPGPHTIKLVNKATPGHPRIDLDAVLYND